MRVHIIIPKELIDDVDRIAGKHKRSRFIEKAIREKLLHLRQEKIPLKIISRN